MLTTGLAAFAFINWLKIPLPFFTFSKAFFAQSIFKAGTFDVAELEKASILLTNLPSKESLKFSPLINFLQVLSIR